MVNIPTQSLPQTPPDTKNERDPDTNIQSADQSKNPIPLKIPRTIVIILLVLGIGMFFLIKNNLMQQEKQTPIYSEQTPTPTIGPIFDDCLRLCPDNSTVLCGASCTTLTSTPTKRPTSTLTSTPLPTTTNTPTSTPTPTPTRTPSPPIIEITYPSENQFITMTSSQTLCVGDFPRGGNTEGIQRKHQLNDGGWTSYTDMFTLCIDPKEGLNRLQMQYKNKYGDESTQYTRQFNFHRISSVTNE